MIRWNYLWITSGRKMEGSKKQFKEPYQTLNEIRRIAHIGKIRYIIQEINNGRSMRNIAKELGCSVENISILVKEGKKLKLA